MELINTELPKHLVPKADYNAKVKEVKTANETIETLKKDNKDNEALQTEITNYKTKVTTLEKQNQDIQRSYAVKEKLTALGALDAEYLIFKQGGVDKFTFDADGRPVGVEDVVKTFKASSPQLFKVENPGGGYHPAGGGGGPVVNPFAKETFNLTEQGKLFRENPEQARAMAKAAGVEI